MTSLNEAHFWFFSALKMISHHNSLWPSSIRKLIKLFPLLQKQPGSFHAWLFGTTQRRSTALIQKVESAKGSKSVKAEICRLRSRNRGRQIFLPTPKPWVRLPHQQINGFTICSIVERNITLRHYFWRCAMTRWKGAAWERLWRNAALSKELVISWIILLKLCYIIS